MRREFTPSDLDANGPYHLLNQVVIPRPIAWVATTSASGVHNLAPHSYFTIAATNPPIVMFTSLGTKDTLANVTATGEFVVCFSPRELFETINDTATNYPPELSEFDELGIEREPSRYVATPRVAASPVALECRVHKLEVMGDATLVFGEVLCVAIDERFVDLTHPRRPQLSAPALAPLARLGRNEWATLGEVLDIKRKRYEG